MLSRRRPLPGQQICLELVKRERNHADAIDILANLAVQRGFLDRARDYFERLAKLRPRDPAAHANLGKVRAGLGQLREAIAAFDRALALKAAYPPALAGKADALNRLGEALAARALLEPILAAGGEDAELAFIYATILQQSGEHEAALGIAARHLQKRDSPTAPPPPPAVERLLGFLIGKSLEALGRYDEAFAAHRAANEIDSGAAPFNAEEFVTAVDQLIAFFTPERMARLSKAGNQSRLPVFIAGMARSGTTLVEQIIHAHPRAFGAGELPDLDAVVMDLPAELASLLPYPQCLTAMTPADADRLSARYLGRLRALAATASEGAVAAKAGKAEGGGARTAKSAIDRVVDKNLRIAQHLGMIAALFPRASIIHCRRDPLDTCLSCYMSPLAPAKHAYASDLRHIGLVYRQYERLMEHWRATLPMQILEVVYEELVADQEGVTRRIIAHVGLEWDERCLRSHEARRAVRTLSYDQVRRPIYGDSIGRHLRYEAHLQPLREALGDIGGTGHWA